MQVQYWVIRSVSAPIVKYRTFECALHRKRGWCTNTCTCTNTNTNTNTTTEHNHKTQTQSQTQPQTQTEARACALRRMRRRMEVTACYHMSMAKISTTALSSMRVCVAGSLMVYDMDRHYELPLAHAGAVLGHMERFCAHLQVSHIRRIASCLHVCAPHRKRGWNTNTNTSTNTNNTNTNTNTKTNTNTATEHKHKTQTQSQTQPQAQTQTRACALHRMRHRMGVTTCYHMPMAAFWWRLGNRACQCPAAT